MRERVLFNQELLRKNAEDLGTNMVVELAGLFSEDIRDRLAELDRNLRDGNVARVGAIGHSIKGSAGQLGLELLQEMGTFIESAYHIGNVAAVPLIVPKLHQLVRESEAAIHAYANSLPPNRPPRWATEPDPFDRRITRG